LHSEIYPTIADENNKILFRSSIDELNDIANRLLEDGKSQNIEPMRKSSIIFLSSLIDAVVTQSRYQYRTLHSTRIEAQFKENARQLFAEMDGVEFKSLIFNLIKNAVEAIDSQGYVKVILGTSDNHMSSILVEDNGKGISPDILEKLGKLGESHKEGGHGIALYHARRVIESFGGTFSIDSALGKGTAIRILLPQTPPPSWFVSSLNVMEGCTIVILDDEIYIHTIWKKRFQALMIQENISLHLQHFSTLESFQAFYQGCHQDKILYLIDYKIDLTYPEHNGLDLIESLGIVNKSVLVTSYFCDPEIQKHCQRIGLRMLPKTSIDWVPIQIVLIQEDLKHAKIDYDDILIDNNPLVRWQWLKMGKKFRRKVGVFSTVQNFYDTCKNISANTIYIDSDLGDGIKGEIEAKTIYDLGFKEICLTTNHDPECFDGIQHREYIREIIKKNPPWTS